MNNFSCSLSCTWMTIIDSLFYAPDSLFEIIAKLLAAWLYHCPLKLQCLSFLIMVLRHSSVLYFCKVDIFIVFIDQEIVLLDVLHIVG